MKEFKFDNVSRNGEILIDDSFIKFMLGDRIASGHSRTVYETPSWVNKISRESHLRSIKNKKNCKEEIPQYVIKVAHSYEALEMYAGIESNISEYKTWHHFKDTELGKFLAPVHSISNCGRYMIMQRVHPIKSFPASLKLPDVFSDVKPSNWGILTDEKGKDRYVCCDYAILYLKGNIKLEYMSANDLACDEVGRGDIYEMV